MSPRDDPPVEPDVAAAPPARERARITAPAPLELPVAAPAPR